MNEVSSTHYSYAQQPGILSKTAKQMAHEVVSLSKKKKTNNIPVLCYTGMSGVANATAVSLAIHDMYPEFEFYMAYVRKEGEHSHGRDDIEYSRSPSTWEMPYGTFAVFVDDLIDSGKTKKRVVEAIKHNLPRIDTKKVPDVLGESFG